MKRRCVILTLLFLVVVILVTPLFLNYWVKENIETSLKIKYEGRVIPMFFRASFKVDGYLAWEDRAELKTGSLTVNYRPKTLLSPEPLRIGIHGENLEIALLSDWAEEFGVAEIPVHELTADISIDRNGINEIHFLDVNSPSMQFKIQKSGKAPAGV